MTNNISGSSIASPFVIGSNGNYQTTSDSNVITGIDTTGDTVTLGAAYGGNAIAISGATTNNVINDSGNGDQITVDGWDFGSGNTVTESGYDAKVEFSTFKGTFACQGSRAFFTGR